MTGFLYDNAVVVSLVWMLLANLFAIGPRGLKVAALVMMLLTAGPIVVAVVASSGWLIGLPILILMCIQMRWAVFFILRLARHYGLIEEAADEQ